eukprot:6214444-Pleurochrysis_carterae.AAC.1
MTLLRAVCERKPVGTRHHDESAASAKRKQLTEVNSLARSQRPGHRRCQTGMVAAASWCAILATSNTGAEAARWQQSSE